MLRPRFLGGKASEGSSEPSREPTPGKSEEVQLVSAARLRDLKSKKLPKRRIGLFFGLGGLFGVLVAAFFAQKSDVINLEGLLDLNLDSLIDVVPASIVKDAKDITVRAATSLVELLARGLIFGAAT